jgi:peptidoglycan/xylan/chitin deacetylase (PgdA/CDA1 family)
MEAALNVPDRQDGLGLARLAHLAFWRPALRVLCYHRVHPSRRDRHTVTTAQLDAQLAYLARSGFGFIRARDLISGSALPGRPLLLTFDDGYLDTLKHALPVLRRHGARATMFVVTGYAGAQAPWLAEDAPLMGPRELRELDPDVIELALHSHSHRAFAAMGMDEIEDDLRKSLAFFREHGIGVTPALAYPYGSRPEGGVGPLAERLARLGIPLAFRMGYRLNRFPIRNRYEIQRIGVGGETGEAGFRRRLWLGKLL